MYMRKLFVVLLSLSLAAPVLAEDSTLERSVQELQTTHGPWSVTTEFLNEDGGETWKPGNQQVFMRP